MLCSFRISFAAQFTNKAPCTMIRNLGINGTEVSPEFEWRTDISQSTHSEVYLTNQYAQKSEQPINTCRWVISQSTQIERTHHSLNHQFYPSVQNHFFLVNPCSKLIMHELERDKHSTNSFKHVGHFCSTLCLWEQHSLSLQHTMWIALRWTTATWSYKN